MKNVFKDYVWPIALILVDIALRNTSIGWANVLLKPIPVNIIEILIFALLVAIFYRLISGSHTKRANRSRATRLQGNWEKFKVVLRQHIETKKDLQKEYDVLRKEIRKDVNYFLTEIADALKKTGNKHENIVVSNFETCLSPDNIADWQQKVRREVPRELDCFDYIPSALVRHFDK